MLNGLVYCSFGLIVIRVAESISPVAKVGRNHKPVLKPTNKTNNETHIKLNPSISVPGIYVHSSYLGLTNCLDQRDMGRILSRTEPPFQG